MAYELYPRGVARPPAPARKPTEWIARGLQMLVVRLALPHITAKLAALAREMGLQSAEIILFPAHRRRLRSPLLSLSSRAHHRSGAERPVAPAGRPRRKSR